MIDLVFAIVSSALISIAMRLSTDRVTGNVSMLAMNYLTCLLLAAGFAGFDDLLPRDPQLPGTLVMGAVHGVLFLLAFVLFQRGVKQSGVVLASIFMKLGLLVPLVVSIFLFGEMPTAVQAAGFCVAVGAIALINLRQGETSHAGSGGLVILLLAGGSADAMSKVYEQWGSAALSRQFLVYTFLVAFALCAVLAVSKKQRLGKNEVFFGCLIGIPNFFAARFLLRALETMPAVIVYPSFSVGTILLVSLAGVVLFRERLSRRQWLAVGATVVALVMLNI